ncbi:hypothetical protein [Caulobacter vibrioides]|uniref:hypothetical protein n=1 Tax=Caulobacter vibrioides TaxID=155892 RepID=UPI000BB4A9D4|nr:hypothetical protein [Caulobacter vibrioides]ATC26491.1 hypothetical protein CA608_19140 [Caulobacter vibrioides]PLR12313.1 hypothetical protein CVUC_08770 [Caulobacter vibrioides]
MFVKMLTAMAGDSFSYDHGAVVEVSAKYGKAWIAAGLAEETRPTDVLEAEVDKQAGVAKEAVAKFKVAERDLAIHKADLATARQQIEALTGQLSEAQAATQALATEVEELKAALGDEKEAKLTALEELDTERAAKEILEKELEALKTATAQEPPPAEGAA